MWESAGRPRSGHVFNIMKSAKYAYKLAIKDAVNSFEKKFSDELYDCLMSKDLHLVVMVLHQSILCIVSLFLTNLVLIKDRHGDVRN